MPYQASRNVLSQRDYRALYRDLEVLLLLKRHVNTAAGLGFLLFVTFQLAYGPSFRAHVNLS